jgi:hypothetical protein
VAAPVRALAPARGRAISRGTGAIYVDFNGFVVAVTAHPVPALPNSISLRERELPHTLAGAVSHLSRDEIVVGDAVVDLLHGPDWDPAVERNTGRSVPQVEGRARAVAEAILPAPTLPEAWVLMKALSEPHCGSVGTAARNLLGRGGGLTPEGDDVIVGAIAAVLAFGGPAGVSPQQQGDLLAAMGPPFLRRRTTSLSATLIELAVDGRVAEPLQSVLDLATSEVKWRRAASQLRTLGHSTGRAWCWGAASAAISLLGRGADTGRVGG